MSYIIKKDWNGYLAEVEWNDSIFAFWITAVEAKKELISVIEMMIDYHSELVENEKSLKESILNTKELNYAV